MEYTDIIKQLDERIVTIRELNDLGITQIKNEFQILFINYIKEQIQQVRQQDKQQVEEIKQMASEMIIEGDSIIRELLAKIDKKHIPTDTFEKAYLFVNNTKVEKPDLLGELLGAIENICQNYKAKQNENK